MKPTLTLKSATALAAFAFGGNPAASAAIIANGNLNTALSQYGSPAGNTPYSLNTTSSNVLEGSSDTGLDANEWVWSSLSRGFAYDPAGGAGGSGDGAFVPYTPGDSFNQKPRAVAQFATDNSTTTGLQTISMDVFLDDNSANNALTFLVELYAWEDGQTGPELSLGGPDGNLPDYNVTTLGDAATILGTSVAATDVANASWETVTLGNVDLGPGYDFYAWRIGIMGATDGDDFAFDNVTVIPEPSTSLLAGLFVAGSLLRRRRLVS